jgi:hypothetical protein
MPSLSDIRFAEIRAPQMLVGQKGEEALDLMRIGTHRLQQANQCSEGNSVDARPRHIA